MQYTYEGPGFSISNALLQATGLAHVGIKVKQKNNLSTLARTDPSANATVPTSVAEPEPVEPKIFETKFPFY